MRLSKITKGLFDKTWNQKTFSKGATFDMNVRDRISVETALLNEDFPCREILSTESEKDSEEIIVI